MERISGSRKSGRNPNDRQEDGVEVKGKRELLQMKFRIVKLRFGFRNRFTDSLLPFNDLSLLPLCVGFPPLFSSELTLYSIQGI
jgi:hypothetical protein